ncbi:ankyrin repeat domain-containing protein [Paenibacillus sp. SI8]|uniref:ankyrin repeat domain-containing protein n=1 Tax=unclassified Paenibacillus TaxID=185978 RepID=UPI0034662A69
MINEVFSAARNGELGVLRGFLDSKPALANTENEDGLTLLGFAAHFGQTEAVKLLLDRGADVNAVSHSKVSYIPSNTALHAAIAGERSMDVIRLILAHDADTNLFDSNGHTSVHAAAFHDHNTEMIQLLIDHGADVNAKVEGGVYAIALAKEQGNLRVAELLRQQGAIE